MKKTTYIYVVDTFGVHLSLLFDGMSKVNFQTKLNS